MPNDKINPLLKDLVDIGQWQKMQDHFAEVIGVGIRTVDRNGNLITKASNISRICAEIMADSSAGVARCNRCLPPSLDSPGKQGKWKEGFECHLGLHNFCIPVLTFEKQTVAYLLVGPVLLGHRWKTEAYRQKARELKVEPEKLLDCLSEVKLFTFTGIRSVIELINDISSYLIQLGYNRFKLERIIPLPKLGKVVHRFYMDKILSTLLDVSSDTLQAECGSVMLLDEETGELYIKIAKGLSKDIINKARLKIGEGIAGLAIKENRSFLIDKKTIDVRIKPLLRRPQIKSSFIAPLSLMKEPLGVLNISTNRPSVKFTPAKIETLRRLINLTETTLQDLRKF
ncbi:PocR ligand-binding domain-containing protein [Candidatus Omnitrophota bacterium]